MEPQDSHLPATVIEMLRATTALVPDKPALMAPGRPDFSRTRLVQHVEDTVARLNRLGFSRTSRIGLALPNGPEAAGAFICVVSGMIPVPLNPNFQAAEFESQLRLAKADAVIVLQGQDTPVRAVAERLGVRVIELRFTPDMPAGLFEIVGTQPAAAAPIFSEPNDIAVMMPTSGTTGLPKFVPQTHAKIIIGTIYESKQRGQLEAFNQMGATINMLPLFHGYGLVGSLLLVIAFNGSAVCTAGFDARRFFDWMDEYRPLFLLVLPTMLDAILAEAPAHEDAIKRSSLQYIACASAPLSEQTIIEATRILNKPIIQAYGMTEVGYIAITIPGMVGFHRSGSVGQTIIETAIMAKDGTLVPPGEIGEIVVRDPNLPVFGDERDTEMFRNGWFRTGDKGYLDADNYLYITGRVKESINRGGEKISPFEVEEFLKSHPAIRDATVFGVPHTLLSEDLAAAVVTSDPALTPKAVRKFVGEHLSSQKVPAIVLMVDEIPRTPIGKVQRSALPQLLGLVDNEGHRLGGRALFGDPPVAPRSDTEQKLVRLWSEILALPEIGIHDDFFDLGGTSLQAAALVTRIAREFHTTLSVDTMFEAATVAEMAEVIARPERDTPWPTLIPIQPSGTKPPFFCLPGLSGVVLSFRELALHLGSDQPVYGLQPPGIDGKTPPLMRMDDLAAHFAQAIRSVQPNGPYMLGGYSFGGMVALEVARLLRAQGGDVALLASFDGPLDVSQHPRIKGRSPTQKFIRRVKRLRTRLAAFNPMEKAPSILEELEDKLEKTAENVPVLPGIQNVSQANRTLTVAYQPKPYEGQAVLFSTQEMRLGKSRASFEQAWEKIVLGGIQVCDVPGDHDTILHEPFVQVLAEKLSGYIERVLVVTGESRG